MLRFHIRNNLHMVEFPATAAGKMQAKAFRASHPQFKGRHIREVLQLIPSKVPCGEIVDWYYKVQSC